MKYSLAERTDMNEKPESGSSGTVSQMLCIVTAAILFLNFAMQDYIVVSHQKKISQRINDFACSSVMASFDSVFENYYGIYCLDTEKEESILKRYYEIVNESRNSFAAILLSDDSLSSFYVPERKVGAYSVSFERTLDQKEEFKREIKSLMEKKSWTNMATFVVEKLAALVGIEKETDIYKLLNDFDNCLEEIEEEQKQLEPYLNGIEGVLGSGVNGFFSTPFANAGTLNTDSILKMFPGGICVLSEEGTELLKKALEAFLVPAGIYGGWNKKAEEAARSILEITEKAETCLLKAEKALSTGDFEDSVRTELRVKIHEKKRKISNIGDYKKICMLLESNIANLDGAYNSYYSFCAEINGKDYALIEDVKAVVNEAENAYKKYQKVEQGEILDLESDTPPGLDDLFKRAVDATSVILDFMPSGNTEITKDIYDKLPSKRAGVKASIPYGSTLNQLLDFDALSNNLDDFGKAFGEERNFDSVLDMYYLDDYIMTYFNSSGEKERPELYSYLNGEIEYIIFGNSKDDDNLAAAYGSLYALRTALNIVHILRDEEKMEAIESVSEHPVIVGLLVSVWSMFESAFDITNLRNGEKVPLVKTGDDWNCDLDGIMSNVSSFVTEKENENENLSALSYTDYLRILLALTDFDTKLLRIQDLLELNYWKVSGSYRELSEFATAIKTESEIVIDTILFKNSRGKKRGVFKVVSNGYY